MSTEITWTWVPDGKGGRKTGETWNPQTGCSEVSPGCRNCYAAKTAARGMSPQHRGLTRSLPLLDKDGDPVLDKDGKPKIKPNSTHWNGTIKHVPHLLEKPLRWRKPRGIFVGSMTDIFHETNLATEDGRRYIAAISGVMAACPQHTGIFLTKRPGKMREWFEWLADQGAVAGSHRHGLGNIAALEAREGRAPDVLRGLIVERWPLPNVWLMTTAEDQKRADERIADLLACPAAVYGLSVEPMLGPVVLPAEFLALGSRAWVVCGGESGPGARPMHPAWARALRDQCVEAGIPFNFKQWGAWGVHAEADDVIDLPWFSLGEVDRVHQTDVPSPVQMRRVGKKAAGRELDGRTWDEFPG